MATHFALAPKRTTLSLRRLTGRSDDKNEQQIGPALVHRSTLDTVIADSFRRSIVSLSAGWAPSWKHECVGDTVHVHLTTTGLRAVVYRSSVLLTPDMLSLVEYSQRQKPLRRVLRGLVRFRANLTPGNNTARCVLERKQNRFASVYHNPDTYRYVFQCARSNISHVLICFQGKDLLAELSEKGSRFLRFVRCWAEFVSGRCIDFSSRQRDQWIVRLDTRDTRLSLSLSLGATINSNLKFEHSNLI